MRRFWGDQKGSVLTFFGFTAATLFALVAFSVDTGNLYYNKSQLQAAADAAALGAVLSLPSTSTVASEAVSLAASNVPASFGTVASTTDVVIGTWNPLSKTFTASSSNQNAVKVTVHRTTANRNPVQTFLGGFIGATSVDVNAHAIAVKMTGSCVIVLNSSASNALYASGSGSVSLNCPLQVNSSDSQGAYTQGGSTVSASKICVTGGYKGNGFSPSPQTSCPVLPDPLASMPEPTQPSANCVAPPSGGTMASNCTYTGNVTINGNTTLQSGTIYFHNATVTFGASAQISGSNVLLFFNSGSSFDFSGASSISITPASTGNYAGVAIFQSRSTPVSTVDKVWGNGTLSLGGTIYAPSSQLALGGNSTLTISVGYAIASKLSFGGSSQLSIGVLGTGGSSPRILRVHTSLVS